MVNAPSALPAEKRASGIMEMHDTSQYGAYMRLLARVFEQLGSYYGQTSREDQTDSSEERSMALYAQKFLATLHALDLKYRFSPAERGRPSIASSGFPYFYDIMKLDADLSTRAERLPKFPELKSLKSLLLDSLMVPRPDPNDPDARSAHEERRKGLVWQIAERAYLDSLDLRTQFFFFTPGLLMPITPGAWAGEEKGRRAYLFSWGCFDIESNRPCVYFMLFTQLESARPLHEPGNPEYVRFLETVQHLGGRAPKELKVVAVRFDETFGTLFPKVLKRITIGPLVSPMLYKQLGEYELPKGSAKLAQAFEDARASDDDFLLHLSTEFVLSRGEVAPEPKFSALFTGEKEKARQVFHVPKTDRKLLERGASSVQHYALMPHRLRQHLTEDILAEIPELADTATLVYQEGEIAHVG